ncbi:Uncharacterised protein [Serratia ficaria]|nr:Uncharacterised protein [Serratia ficaria]
MVGFIPFFVLSEHRIQDGQQLAHTGNQSDFFSFSGGDQAYVKRFYHRIKAGCHKCRHVQRSSHTSPATKDGSSSSHRARVPVYRRNAHKCADFTSGEATKFRDIRKQCRSSHGANTFNTAQSLSKLFKVALDVTVHIFIDPRELIFQRFDDGINAFPALGMCGMQPVTLSHQHRNQLASAHHHRSKNLPFSIRQLPDKAFPLRVTINDLCHLREHSGVNTVSLCQISHGTGKVAGLSGVNDSNVKPFSLKRAGHGGFKPASSLHQNQRNGVFSQFSNNGIKTIRVVTCSELYKLTGCSNVQCCFGNINSHTEWIWLTHYYPSLQMRSGVRTTVRVSDEWLSVCASRLLTGYEPLEISGCIRLAKSIHHYGN